MHKYNLQDLAATITEFCKIRAIYLFNFTIFLQLKLFICYKRKKTVI